MIGKEGMRRLEGCGNKGVRRVKEGERRVEGHGKEGFRKGRRV